MVVEEEEEEEPVVLIVHSLPLRHHAVTLNGVGDAETQARPSAVV